MQIQGAFPDVPIQITDPALQLAAFKPELEQLECENKARALFSAAEEALRYAGEARIGQ